MNLPEYIELIGIPAAAVLFGVKERTIVSWRYRERYPRPQQANRIVEATKGKVGYADIYAKKPGS